MTAASSRAAARASAARGAKLMNAAVAMSSHTAHVSTMKIQLRTGGAAAASAGGCAYNTSAG